MSPTTPYVQPGEPLNDFLRSFWQRQIDAAEQETPDYRHPPLPLARIKKVMKSDPDVKVCMNAPDMSVLPTPHNTEHVDDCRGCTYPLLQGLRKCVSFSFVFSQRVQLEHCHASQRAPCVLPPPSNIFHTPFHLLILMNHTHSFYIRNHSACIHYCRLE